MQRSNPAFTLIELLVVIAIIAVLSVVVILSLNPADLLRQTRDSGRISDMETINKALGLTQVEGLPLGTVNTVYVSIPDPTATSTAGDQCQGLGLPSLPATYTYHCAASSTYRNVNGTGWVPVNFTASAQGSSMGQLPQDPVNTTSSRLYYTYVTNGYQYETTAVMESSKYKLGGSKDVTGTDGGPLASVYEKGTKLGLEPLDYGDNSLVGYWTFDEGTGSIAYDYSGSNATGSWSGSGIHWATGRIGSGAGQFASTTSDYLNVGNLGTFPGQGTISFWMTVTTIPATYPNALTTSRDGGNSGIRFEENGSGLYSYDGATANTYTGSLLTNTWYHVVFTWNTSANNETVYLNGGRVSSSGCCGNFPGTIPNLAIGQGFGRFWSGLIDDVRIYNRALSATEIQAMYNGNK